MDKIIFLLKFLGVAIFWILWRHNSGMEEISEESRGDFRETIWAGNILLSDNTSNYSS